MMREPVVISVGLVLALVIYVIAGTFLFEVHSTTPVSLAKVLHYNGELLANETYFYQSEPDMIPKLLEDFNENVVRDLALGYRESDEVDYVSTLMFVWRLITATGDPRISSTAAARTIAYGLGGFVLFQVTVVYIATKLLRAWARFSDDFEHVKVNPADSADLLHWKKLSQALDAKQRLRQGMPVGAKRGRMKNVKRRTPSLFSGFLILVVLIVAIALVSIWYGPCASGGFGSRLSNAFYSLTTIRELPCDTVTNYKWFDRLRTVVPFSVTYVLLAMAVIKIGQGFFSLLDDN